MIEMMVSFGEYGLKVFSDSLVFEGTGYTENTEDMGSPLDSFIDTYMPFSGKTDHQQFYSF